MMATADPLRDEGFSAVRTARLGTHAHGPSSSLCIAEVTDAFICYTGGGRWEAEGIEPWLYWKTGRCCRMLCLYIVQVCWCPHFIYRRREVGEGMYRALVVLEDGEVLEDVVLLQCSGVLVLSHSLQEAGGGRWDVPSPGCTGRRGGAAGCGA